MKLTLQIKKLVWVEARYDMIFMNMIPFSMIPCIIGLAGGKKLVWAEARALITGRLMPAMSG